MSIESSLFGGCTCGRNQYTVTLPSVFPAVGRALVFDESSDSSRSRSSPLPIFLRVPLDSLHSTTYAFFDDERHQDIRKSFTPRHSPHTKRQFCGFCGTPLTIWTESKISEADFIRVSLSSLERTSLDLLEDLGLLVLDKDDEEVEGDDSGRDVRHGHNDALQSVRRIVGHPWLEETIGGSELGRVRRREGYEISADGRSKVEWEIMESSADAGEGDVTGSSGSVKRKLDSVSGPGDILMKGGH